MSLELTYAPLNAQLRSWGGGY